MQGSIIGPAMFLVFINDVIYSSNLLKFIIYADDTNILLRSNSLTDLYQLMNTELSRVLSWVNANKLTINTDKTNYVIFHRRRRQVYYSDSVYVGETEIKQLSEVKFLDVCIDSSLMWREQVQHILLKVVKYVVIFYRVRSSFLVATLGTLYNCLVHSNIVYCNSVWGACSKTVLSPLCLLQKKLIRIIFKCNYRDHSAPLFAMLNILPMPKINQYETGLFVYKNINNINGYQWFERCTNNYNTRSVTDGNVIVARTTANNSRQGIKYNGAIIWNKIPCFIRNCPSFNTFKKHFKEHLISN